METATLTREDKAKEFAGAHRKEGDFSWYDEPEDGENWGIYLIESRDSGLLELSNAAAKRKELEAFIESGDVREERFNHWACGWVEGLAIRVYKEGTTELTDAFNKLCELQEKLENYPVLDDEDYSRRGYEAALENIADVGRRMVIDDAPEDWTNKVFSWLWDNTSEMEDTDDRGAYPSEESVKLALHNVKLLDPEYAEGLEPIVSPDTETGNLFEE